MANLGFRFGPFTLNCPERLLLRDGEPVRIGSRSLDILIALVSRPGEVVSKEELISIVWPRTFVEETNLRVNVGSLRKALDDVREPHRYISNVTGRGYCFVAPGSVIRDPAGLAQAMGPCGRRKTCATTRFCTRPQRACRTTSPGRAGSGRSALPASIPRGPRFPHTYLALQAAASGQGVALATNVLIGDYLEAGRLVRPFPLEVKGSHQYHVACPEETADRPAIAAFRAWLLSEARG